MNYQTQTWPAERFYWALIESDHTADQLGTRQALLHLDSLLEPHLPVTLDEIHAVYVSLGNGQVLTCAAPRSELELVPAEWVSLSPSGLPEFLCHLQVDVASLNVLQREFTPRVFRHSAKRRTLIACAAMVLCTVLICMGWLRRVHAAADLSTSTEHEVVTAANRTLSSDFQTATDAQNALQSARDRATMLASSGKELATFDAAMALQSLLAIWPHSDDVTVLNLSVTQDAVSLNIDVRGDAQAFLRSLAVPGGWKLDEPRLTSSNGTSRVAVVLHPPHDGGAR